MKALSQPVDPKSETPRDAEHTEPGSDREPGPATSAGNPVCVDGPDGCSPQIVERADGQFRCGMHEIDRRTRETEPGVPDLRKTPRVP
jgi:hypothetical protein